MSEMIIGIHVKYPLFLSDLNETWIFSTDSRKNAQIYILLKSAQWEPSCSTRPDEQTDTREGNSHISQNCEKRQKKPKKISIVI
jgi:hypothetical protein